MEQERIARAAARKREKSISPPSRKRMRLESPQSQRLPGESLDTSDAGPAGDSAQSSAKTHHGLRFPKGVIMKTFARHHPRDRRTIKIEDIIDRQHVRTAVLSTFMLDADWILSTKFDLTKTKFYLILHAKSDEDRAMMRQDFAPVRQARLCLPRLTGAIGCQHSKLMMLFFAEYVRIVLPSANLVDFDWGESGLMENSVFIVDLPRRAHNSEQLSAEDLPLFGRHLIEFLNNQGVSNDVRDGLLKFDFDATTNLAFIHTSEGAHFDSRAMHTGLPSLSAAVRQLGLATEEDIHVDIAASSIGSLSDEFINAIYEAAQGKDITTTVSRERRKKRNAKVEANVRIYFPTDETVKASIGGSDNGGTICLQKSFWDKPGFHRQIFRDYRSARQGLLSHNKLLFVRGKKVDGSSIAWVYVGSANCSSSAWGTLVTKAVKLNCNNWESGVLLPVDNPPEDLSDLGKVFESVMDVPFEYGDGKGLEYGARNPWFFMRKDRL